MPFFGDRIDTGACIAFYGYFSRCLANRLCKVGSFFKQLVKNVKVLSSPLILYQWICELC